MSTSTAETTIITSDTDAAPSRRRRVSPAVAAALTVILAAGCTTTAGSSDPLAIADAAGSVPPVTANTPAAPATTTTATTPPPPSTTTDTIALPATTAPTTTTTATTTTTTAAPTPVLVPEPVIAADPGCGAWPAIPPAASGVSSATIDAVGDGTADDTVTAYLNGTWRLRLESAAGVVSEVAVDDVGPGYVEVLGAVQIDELAGDQVLAVVSSGASGVGLGVFGTDEQGCLSRFTQGDGTAIDLTVGGTTGWHQGVFCAGNTLFSYGADATTDDEWQAWGVDLQRSGATTLDEGVLDTQPGMPADELPVYGLACPGLSL